MYIDWESSPFFLKFIIRSLLPCQRRMAAQIDLDGGREPTKFKSVVESTNECRLRQVHLGGNGLHPVGVPFCFEQTDGGGVACERAIREGINDK